MCTGGWCPFPDRLWEIASAVAGRPVMLRRTLPNPARTPPAGSYSSGQGEDNADLFDVPRLFVDFAGERAPDREWDVTAGPQSAAALILSIGGCGPCSSPLSVGEPGLDWSSGGIDTSRGAHGRTRDGR